MSAPSAPLDMQFTLATALVGRYTITRELGRGGMATVYLADDLKHQRQVAIKVLLPELGAVLGAERFLSEIRVTANLQHPNLLPLFDSGDAGGLLYYVMPYVEGETLRARLDREQQLPVEEAVRLARTMASALDYAHQRGVIHRDLKPENVLLQAGQPVIADFGIALAVAQAGGQRITQTGLSLGTPQYMSPEQATGDKQLDGRTDIYALGAMTYEMLTGEPPHVGNSAQAIIAKLMTEEVRSLTVLRKSVPASVDTAVRRALEKLPADRFATAGAFAMALGDDVIAAGRYAPVASRTDKRIMAALAAALLVTSTVAGWSVWHARTNPTIADAPVVRFAVKVDFDGKHALGGGRVSAWGQPATNALALSPSGDRIAYAAWDSLDEGHYRSHLYIRRLNDVDAKELAGTEGAAHPAFSPDGQWLAFTNATGIARMNVGDGTVQAVAAAPNACCLAWDTNNTIVFTDSTRRALWQVPAAGGQPRRIPLVIPGDSGTPVLQPLPLANSATLLFHTRNGRAADSSAIYRLDRKSGKTTRLLSDAADPRVVANEFLLFMRRGTLMAVRFDEATGTVQGEPVLVVDSVMQSLNMPNLGAELGIGAYAVSSRGDLVYARGGAFTSDLSDLVVVHPGGTTDTVPIGIATLLGARMSPTGDRIAFYGLAPRTRAFAVFVHDRVRGVTTTLSEGGSATVFPEWSMDGRSIAFTSNRAAGISEAFVVAADGSGTAQRVVTSPGGLALTGWSASGVFVGNAGGTLWTAREGEAPKVLFQSPAPTQHATFSPDGKWIAYATDSDNSGDVFVRPYPRGEPAVQISNAGGGSPAWSPDGKWLYFLTPGSVPAMMRVAIKSDGGLGAGAPAVVLPRWPYVGSQPSRSYDVLRDGALLAVMSRGGVSPSSIRSRHKVTEFQVVMNFVSELRARVR